MRPFGEIQAFARVADMTIQPPGDRRHVPVPRPTRFVGVTVVTSGPEHGGDFSRWRVGAEQIVSGRDVGRGASDIRQLQQYEHGQQNH